MPSIIIHLYNEDPVLGEVDELPQPDDTMIFVKNPRRKDGKDLPYLELNVNRTIWPLNRISFIELLPSGKDEEIITFVRE